MKVRLHPKAAAELDALKRRVISTLGMHIITLEQAQRLFWEEARKIFAQGLTEDSSDAFPIVCNGCGQVVVVASDVVRYTCRCSPRVERFTFQSRKLDLPIGKRPIEDLMAANAGRQHLVAPTE